MACIQQRSFVSSVWTCIKKKHITPAYPELWIDEWLAIRTSGLTVTVSGLTWPVLSFMFMFILILWAFIQISWVRFWNAATHPALEVLRIQGIILIFHWLQYNSVIRIALARPFVSVWVSVLFMRFSFARFMLQLLYRFQYSSFSSSLL